MTAIQAAAEALLEAGYSLPEPSPGNDSPDAQTRPSLLAYEVEEVANEAWVDQIKASYVPISISPHLYIGEERLYRVGVTLSCMKSCVVLNPLQLTPPD